MRIYVIIALLLVYRESFAQELTESNLPIIIINTQGDYINDEPKITALMKVINNPDKVNSVADTNFEYNGYIGIETRGNTSQMLFDKLSYSFETRTDSGTNLNVSLLGLPKENDWVLYGPYSDKSLMRNVLAYHLGNLQGRWSPRTRFCEVILNSEYRGVYVLVEKIKIDKNRVDIARLKPEDTSGDELTGGYILRIDRHRDGCWISPFMGRTGSAEVPISYMDPKYDELTEEQRIYIQYYVTDFEYALHGSNFKDPVLGYRPYIDVKSFVDYFIISEISRDLDGYRCSVYFHKDKDSKGGKIVMSPLWDYNLGFGNGSFFGADKTEGWCADGIGSGDAYEIPFWWDRLRTDPYFDTILVNRWNELRSKKFSLDSINSFIDSCATVLDEARKRNFKKFDILDSYVWPNPYIGGNYENEVTYLKNWISSRLSWIDSQMNQTEPLDMDEPQESLAGSNSILVYPNPFSEQVTFRFKLKEYALVQLKLTDILGQEILNYYKSGNKGYNEVTVSNNEFLLKKNIFFYQLIIDGKIVNTGKLLRQ